MNKKTLNEIDYYRIREEISSYCLTQEGKYSLDNRDPVFDLEKIEFYKACSREWEKYITSVRTQPFSAWGPIHGLYAIIKTKGASLTLEQVRDLGLFILSVKKVKESIANHQVELELKALPSKVQELPDLEDSEKKIFRIINADGQLKDLPEILAIRSQIASLNQKIKNIMRSFTSNPKLANVLESSVPVLRGNHQVLAVKSNQQNKIPGIIYEFSQTGQTVYIEPDEAVLCSNELIQKEHQLEVEIKRILTELTESLGSSIPLFKQALPIMELFDTTYAAARWGLEHNCIYSLPLEKEQAPLLLGARHPLLGDKAVPIDIRFMAGKRILIITGPNTGGKTVSLKTFALLAMLNQTGFPIPAAEATSLPIFSNVFADIGDDQSLDQSLSTFSGHMKNIAQAVNAANSTSLILLDELGSGTDPQEGSAIAMSLLDTLIEKKSFVLVTTHHGVLKNYGYTNPACINASVEFNASTLSPSYHLLMGVSGESHALDIAQKSGLPKVIVQKARSYISAEQVDVSTLIKGLNQKHQELDKLKSQADSALKDLEERSIKLKEKEIENKKREHQLKAGKQQELNDFLIHTRRELENLVRNLKEGQLTKDKTKGVKNFISELEKDVDRFEEKYEAEEEKLEKAQTELQKLLKSQRAHTSNKKTKKKMSNAEALKFASVQNQGAVNLTQEKSSDKNIQLKFQEGAEVISKSTGAQGLILQAGKKGYWQVQFGSVKMSVREKDLTLVERKNTLENKVSYTFELNSKEVNGNIITEKDSSRPVFELRLLGMHVDEALKALERQLDLCALYNFTNFSVIHGKGNGILQQAVTDYLSHSSLVKSFEFASADDGGTGKTYVSLL